MVRHWMLHLLQLVLHLIEPVHHCFEFLRHLAKKRADSGIFEVLELGHNVITLFAGFDEINKILQPRSSQAAAIQTFGKHAGKK